MSFSSHSANQVRLTEQAHQNMTLKIVHVQNLKHETQKKRALSEGSARSDDSSMIVQPIREVNINKFT